MTCLPNQTAYAKKLTTRAHPVRRFSPCSESASSPRFLWFDDGFHPLMRDATSPMMLDAIRSSEEIQTEGSSEELIFAQID